MKHQLLVAATILGVAYCPLAVAGKPLPPPGGDSTRLVLRIATECTSAGLYAECVAEYTVPEGYTAVLETVSMYAREVIFDAEVKIIGNTTASFRLPFITANTNVYQNTSATTHSGRITAIAGELIRLRVHGGAQSQSVAASGYLVPSTSSSLAP